MLRLTVTVFALLVIFGGNFQHHYYNCCLKSHSSRQTAAEHFNFAILCTRTN